MEKMKEIILFLIFFLVLFLSKITILNLPFNEDALTYLVPSAEYMAKNSFNPFVNGVSFGHTPLLFMMLAIIFFFTTSPIIAYIIIILFSSLALLFTYLIAEKMFDKDTAIISVILLFTIPSYFALSGIFSTAIPSTALNLAAIYFVIKENKKLYILMISLSILIYEFSMLIIPGILFYVLIKNYKKDKKTIFKELLIYSSPVLLVVFWLFLNKIINGWFFHPELKRFRLTSISPIALIFIRILKKIFFDEFRWILTVLIILAPLTIKSFFKRVKYKSTVFYLILSISLLVIIYFISSLQIGSENFPTLGSHIQEIYNFRFLIVIIFFIFLTTNKLFLEEWNKNEIILFLSIIMTYAMYHSLFRTNLTRYFVPIFPLLVIIASKSITKIFGNKKYLVTLIIAILFISVWNLHLLYHGDLSSNMEYADELIVESQAIKYIEENYPNSIVLTYGFFSKQGLSSPYSGYTKKPIKSIDIYDNTYFDIFYYNGFIGEERKKDIINEFNLKLEKRFEKNNKYTEIYVKSN